MNELIIAPSVLSLDYSRMEQQIKALKRSKAKWLHFDVMDGHFVPNLTFGPTILQGFKNSCNMLLDVHLMIEDPEKFAPAFIKAGAGAIVFHTEALDNDPQRVSELLKSIREKKVLAGFSVKPGTPIEQFESCLPDADLVLVMSVEPGFGGQSFMKDQLEKVRWLAAKRDELGLNYRIEIDGGINEATARQSKAAGADTLVAGSYVFRGGIERAVETLC